MTTKNPITTTLRADDFDISVGYYKFDNPFGTGKTCERYEYCLTSKHIRLKIMDTTIEAIVIIREWIHEDRPSGYSILHAPQRNDVRRFTTFDDAIAWAQGSIEHPRCDLGERDQSISTDQVKALLG